MGTFNVARVATTVLLLACGWSGRAQAVSVPEWVTVEYIGLPSPLGVQLKWIPVGGATAYRVLRSEKAGDGHKPIATVDQPMDVAAAARPIVAVYLDTMFTPGATYFYVLEAVAADEVLARGEERQALIPATFSAPAWLRKPFWGVSVESGITSHHVDLRWNEVAGAVAYNVYRSVTAGMERQFPGGAANSCCEDGAAERDKACLCQLTVIDRRSEESDYLLKDYQLIGSVWDAHLRGGAAYSDRTVEADKTYSYKLTSIDVALRESGYSREQSAHFTPEKPRRVTPRRTVIPRLASLLWRVSDKRGEMGSLGDGFDLAYDGQADLLYVASTFHRSIVVLRANDGTLLRQIGPRFGDYEIGMPLGLDVDGDGNIYIVDGTKSAVVVLTREGALARVMTAERRAGERQLRLIGVAVLPGGTACVTDNANGQLIFFDGAGREIRRLRVPGREDGGPAGVTNIVATARGDLAVNAALSRRIDLVDSQGAPTFSFGIAKSRVEGFVHPSGLVSLDNGNILVADIGADNIREYKLARDASSYVSHLAKGEGGRLSGFLVFDPIAVAGDGKALLFVLDNWGGRVSAFRLGETQGPP